MTGKSARPTYADRFHFSVFREEMTRESFGCKFGFDKF